MTDLITLILREIDKGDASFADLAAIPDFNGSLSLVSQDCPNIVYWSNVSHDAAHALLQLQGDGLWHFHPTNLLVYAIGGHIMRLPIAKRMRPYKMPHWFPVILLPGLNCGDRKCPRTAMKSRF